jgi:hypothetical protein
MGMKEGIVDYRKGRKERTWKQQQAKAECCDGSFNDCHKGNSPDLHVSIQEVDGGVIWNVEKVGGEIVHRTGDRGSLKRKDALSICWEGRVSVEQFPYFTKQHF